MFKGVKYFSNDQALKLILNSVNDFVSFVDTHLVYCAISQSFADCFGQPPKSLVGQDMHTLHAGSQYLDDFIKYLNASQGQAFSFESKLSFDQQPELIISVDAQPSFNKKGLLVGYTVTARDITDLQASTKALSTELSLAETIVKHSPDLIFLKNPEGRYLSCNPTFARFVGETEENIIGQTDADLMSERSAAYIAEKDRQVLQSREASHIEEWITYNNGERRLVDMHKVPIIDELGELEGLLGIGRDITSEHLVAREKFQAALLFEATSDPCLVLDEEGNIQAANPALVHTLGYAASALESMNVSHFLYDSSGGASVKQALESDAWRGELMAIHISGKGLPFMASVNRIPASDQIGGYVIILSDARTVSAFKDSLLDKAYHDALTGLPNRLLLNARIEHAMRQSYRHACIVAILFIDLDNFKQINDTYGHRVGDKLLVAVTERLKGTLRQTDTLARLGGDEFVVVLDRIAHEGNIVTAVEKLIAQLSDTPYLIEDMEHYVSASIGVSIYPEDGTQAAQLLELADVAMYRAKRSGRNQFCIYHNE